MPHILVLIVDLYHNSLLPPLLLKIITLSLIKINGTVENKKYSNRYDLITLAKLEL